MCAPSTSEPRLLRRPDRTLEKLVITSCNLTGSFNLTKAYGSLTTLDLSNNNLTGYLPHNLMDAFLIVQTSGPSVVSMLKQVTGGGNLMQRLPGLWINLSYNNFTGPLPMTWGNAFDKKAANAGYHKPPRPSLHNKIF